MIASMMVKRGIHSMWDTMSQDTFDVDSFMKSAADDQVWDNTSELGVGETLVGKKAISEWFHKWQKEMPKRKITVKKTGESATINGFKTEKIQVFAGRELIEDHWVTQDADLKEAEKVMDWAAQGFSKEFRSEMKEGQEIYKKLKPYGFPIVIKDYSITYGLKPMDVMEVKKIERRELKDDTFSPPSGYVRITPQPSKK